MKRSKRGNKSENCLTTSHDESFNIMPRGIEVEGQLFKIIDVLGREVLGIVYKSLSREVSILL